MKQFEVVLSVILEAETEDEAFEKVKTLVKDTRDFAVEVYEV